MNESEYGNTLGVGEPARISKEDPACIRAIQVLDRYLGVLEKETLELTERLGRILKPADPAPCEGEVQKDAAEYSEITTGIRNRADRVNRLSKQVRDIIERLEV